MFNVEDICRVDFDKYFYEYILNNSQNLHLDLIQSEVESDFHYQVSNMNSDSFEKFIYGLYETDNLDFFKIFIFIIRWNNWKFNPVISYNPVLDDREESKIAAAENDSYSWMSEVRIFLFRTKNKICLYSFWVFEKEVSNYEIFEINNQNIKTLVEFEISQLIRN